MSTRKPPRPPLLAGLLIGVSISAAAVWWQAPLRVIDGDTVERGWRIRIEPARYRLAGIDAPETRGAKCQSERALGKAATERLRALVAGGDVSLATLVAKDKYGRGVASLSLGRRDVGEQLIAEGLARPYSGRSKRASWCLDPAASER